MGGIEAARNTTLGKSAVTVARANTISLTTRREGEGCRRAPHTQATTLAAGHRRGKGPRSHRRAARGASEVTTSGAAATASRGNESSCGLARVLVRLKFS